MMIYNIHFSLKKRESKKSRKKAWSCLVLPSLAYSCPCQLRQKPAANSPPNQTQTTTLSSFSFTTPNKIIRCCVFDTEQISLVNNLVQVPPTNATYLDSSYSVLPSQIVRHMHLIMLHVHLEHSQRLFPSLFHIMQSPQILQN